MLSLSRPSDGALQRVVQAQADAPFSYAPVGATRGELPADWSVDDRQRLLGQGEPVYRRAVEALRAWAQFELDWVWPLRTDVPLEAGQTFGFLARSVGVWSVNVCRIVYVVDEQDAQGARFGFAYGTVGAHSVRGEERFAVDWDRASDDVAFRIRKFSRPAGPLLTVLSPLTRRIQRRFTEDALACLAARVGA